MVPGEAEVRLETDAAVVNGPGPRWALMGPCGIFHVGGGEVGMACCLEQSGPARCDGRRLRGNDRRSGLRDAQPEDK
jgi:carnitine 3-dehydrogenase